jgi:hypothetical protein
MCIFLEFREHSICIPISGEKNHSPRHLFTLGTHKLLQNGKIAEDFFTVVGEDYGIDSGYPHSYSRDDNHIEVSPPIVSLTSQSIQQMSEVDLLSNSTVMGIDLYVKILSIIHEND